MRGDPCTEQAPSPPGPQNRPCRQVSRTSAGKPSLPTDVRWLDRQGGCPSLGGGGGGGVSDLSTSARGGCGRARGRPTSVSRTWHIQRKGARGEVRQAGDTCTLTFRTQEAGRRGGRRLTLTVCCTARCWGDSERPPGARDACPAALTEEEEEEAGFQRGKQEPKVCAGSPRGALGLEDGRDEKAPSRPSRGG